MILCILCKCSGDFAGAQKSLFIYCEGSIFLCTSEQFQARDGELRALNSKACSTLNILHHSNPLKGYQISI